MMYVIVAWDGHCYYPMRYYENDPEPATFQTKEEAERFTKTLPPQAYALVISRDIADRFEVEFS